MLNADAVEDEVFGELGFMLVNVLLKMQDVSLNGLVYKVGESYR